MSFCGLPPGFGAHVPQFGHQSAFGVILTSGRSLCSTSPHECAEHIVKLCFGQQFPHHTLPSANCGSPLEFSHVMFQFWCTLADRTWDTNSCHFNALSFPHAHTSGDKIHCTSFQKVSSATAEMVGQMGSLFTQCYQRVHFFWDHPHIYDHILLYFIQYTYN